MFKNQPAFIFAAFDDSCKQLLKRDGDTVEPDIETTLRGKEFENVTDVFILSHGWQTDSVHAIQDYQRWLELIELNGYDINPLIIGVHWPSKPWGDESVIAAQAFDQLQSPQAFIAEMRKYFPSSPAIDDVLSLICNVAKEVPAAEDVPKDMNLAYDRLRSELKLETGSPSDSPASDVEDFHPQKIVDAYTETTNSTDFAGFANIPILAPLSVLSYWRMKSLAKKFGESTVANIVAAASRMKSGPRVHLAGHSFGCVVASSVLKSEKVQSVESLLLVQGAMSLWSFADRIPPAKGQPGYFNGLHTKVRGLFAATTSPLDYAVGRFYPLASGVSGQYAMDASNVVLPKYGALGTFGVQGLNELTENCTFETTPSRFEPGRIYNIDCGSIIKKKIGPSGAHCDIFHAEIAGLILRNLSRHLVSS